ncbi:MAG: class I SAM-dependent methyltransferase [Bacteroidaceae bacterium]|nr:class I SAM-dependent methyltransferase [Bacteroidaceae bacterium]MBQ9499493.1 class I SAM-dependent methyltransferase [Bacteroidaceae bacterium]
MKESHDPMGQAIADYFKYGKAETLRVFSPMFDEDELPVATLFRSFEEMPLIEQTALKMATGHTLDVGAGSGCHTLALQQMGLDVTAIDISPLSVKTMQERGVKRALLQDFFTFEEQFDTVLLLMNGAGMVGTVERLPLLFQTLDRILKPGGQLLCDSSDLCYLFEDEDGIIELPDMDGYYGELVYQLQYKNIKGEPFPWLYVDADTLSEQAAACGYLMEIVAQGEHYDYLAKITKK